MKSYHDYSIDITEQMIIDIQPYTSHHPLAELYTATTSTSYTFIGAFRTLSRTLMTGWSETSRRMFVIIPTGT